MITEFKTLPKLLDYFKDEVTCVKYLEWQRWNGTIACPHCGNAGKIYVTNRGYKCAEKTCHKKFSVTSGTIYENTKISLRTWFAAMYLVTVHKKGISSLQLAADLGITQKTAWFLNHRIREMLKDIAPDLLEGMVEIDETFVGGKAKNIHVSKRKKLKKTVLGYEHITPVFGLVQRQGKVKTLVVSEVNKQTLVPIMLNNVSKDSTIVTDNHGSYRLLKDNFKTHEIVAHSNGEYVRGDFHTNTIEGYWSLLKRGIVGIYHFVSPKHLHRYCTEFEYRYNNRKISPVERWESAFKNIEGNRLTYAALINK